MTDTHKSKIGVITATIIGMNAMIGSGIFTAPAIMASNVGPAGIITYIIVVVSVWFLALSLARLAQLFPEQGSFYTYASQWGGHWVGLVASSLYLIGLVFGMGLLAQSAGFYLTRFFPGIPGMHLGAFILSSLIALNLLGLALSELGQLILIACTLFPLLAIIILCFNNAHIAYLTPFAPYGFKNVLSATRVVIFGFFGFESAASLFSVIKNPEKNVPRALTLSIFIVGIIYILFITSLILAVPLPFFANPCVPLSDTLRVIFPNSEWIISIIHISILSAITGTIHSMIWGSSTLLVSLVGKVFPNTSGTLEKSSYTHRGAVLIIGALIFTTFATTRSQNLFFSITALSIIAAFLLSIISLFTITSEWKNGKNTIACIGFATALLIFYFAFDDVIKALITYGT